MTSLSNAFAPPPFDAVADPLRYAILIDHFVAGLAADDTGVRAVGDLGWNVTDVAGAADSDVDLFTTAATIQGRIGVVQLNTGPTTPTAADEASLFLPNVDSIVLNDEVTNSVYVVAVVRLPSITAVEFNFGLFDAADAAGRGVNSISWEFDASADAEWNLVVVDGSAAEAVAAAVDGTAHTVAVDTWYVLEIAAHEDEVLGRVNGGPIFRTTDVDIPNDEPLGPGFKIATETTTEKSVLIDTFGLRQQLVAPF